MIVAVVAMRVVQDAVDEVVVVVAMGNGGVPAARAMGVFVALGGRLAAVGRIGGAYLDPALVDVPVVLEVLTAETRNGLPGLHTRRAFESASRVWKARTPS